MIFSSLTLSFGENVPPYRCSGDLGARLKINFVAKDPLRHQFSAFFVEAIILFIFCFATI